MSNTEIVTAQVGQNAYLKSAPWLEIAYPSRYKREDEERTIRVKVRDDTLLLTFAKKIPIEAISQKKGRNRNGKNFA